MAAGYTELFFDQGTTFVTTLTIGDAYNNAYDLTGYTASGQMRKSYYSSIAVANFVTEIDTEKGTITLSLSVSDTITIAPGRYVYDILLKNNVDNTVTKILEGIVNVSPLVTRT